MSKYILTYSGGGGMAETEAEMAKQMEAWGAWFASLGAAVVDGGDPFGASSTVAPDGSVTSGGSQGATGYSIVNADSLDAAAEMAKGCPVLAGGGSVDVYEGLEM